MLLLNSWFFGLTYEMFSVHNDFFMVPVTSMGGLSTDQNVGLKNIHTI